MPENHRLSSDSELGYGQLFSVLLRRRLWVIGALCCALPLAAMLSLKKEPIYLSSMQFLVEPNYNSASNSNAANVTVPNAQFSSSANVELDYATQIRLMQSSEVLSKAIALLRPEYPTLDIGALKSALSVTRVTETKDKIETNILQVEYTSSNPKKTQKVLQVLEKVYLDYNLQQQEQRLIKGLAFINEQLPEADGSVVQAEKALERFREEQNLIDPQQRAAEISQSLNTISESRRNLQAQFKDAQVRLATLQQQLARSPQSALLASRLSESTRYQALLNALQETELAVAQQRVVFTDNAPTVVNLVQKLNNQRQLLQQEASRVVGTSLNAEAGQLQSEGQLGAIDLKLVADLAMGQSAIRGLGAQDQSLIQTELRLRSELNRYPQLIAQYNRLQPDIETNRETLQQLLRAKQQLGIEIARGGLNWQVVETPQIGVRKGPNLVTDLILGAIVGTFLGATAAFVREATDDLIHSPSKLSETVALPFLGNVPKLPAPHGLPIFQGASKASLPVLEAVNWLPFRESIDLIYKNIQLSQNRSLRSIAVTSALEGEGKSTVALALAVNAARLGQRVLIVDADLRFPSLHEKVKAPNQQGLSSLLKGEQEQPTLHRVSHTDILTSGPKSVDPLLLLSSAAMKDWMQVFQQHYDLVILDCPPVLGIVDAIQTALLCDGVLLVGRINRVSQTALVQAATALNELNVIGVVANGSENHNRSRYSGYISRTAIAPSLSEEQPLPAYKAR
jgi:polysaccharide biosynthesis transport protein